MKVNIHYDLIMKIILLIIMIHTGLQSKLVIKNLMNFLINLKNNCFILQNKLNFKLGGKYLD